MNPRTLGPLTAVLCVLVNGVVIRAPTMDADAGVTSSSALKPHSRPTLVWDVGSPPDRWNRKSSGV